MHLLLVYFLLHGAGSQQAVHMAGPGLAVAIDAEDRLCEAGLRVAAAVSNGSITALQRLCNGSATALTCESVAGFQLRANSTTPQCVLGGGGEWGEWRAPAVEQHHMVGPHQVDAQGARLQPQRESEWTDGRQLRQRLVRRGRGVQRGASCGVCCSKSRRGHW
jgi:hypothetical protein